MKRKRFEFEFVDSPLRIRSRPTTFAASHRIASRRSCEKYLTDTWTACPITTSILPIYMYIMKLATVACVQRPRLRPRPLPQRQTFLNEANNLQTKDEK